MSNHLKFYIDGAFVDPVEERRLEVINPATEEAFAEIALGGARDVDRAVSAARKAFPGFALTTPAQRLALLERMLELYNARYDEIAQIVSQEMGAPLKFAREAQAWAGQVHLEATIEALRHFSFETPRGSTRIILEPIGVVGLITPWNWPLNQIVCKVAPAIAAGCTMVLKPSEIAPLSGVIFAEIMHDAGVPAGVFNLVNGDGPSVGQVLSAHPDIDMMSFTGSTRAGISVAKSAADTVKRVAQELGGKSANIILSDADLEAAVTAGVEACFANSGQSCDAPTRMFVPAAQHAQALEIARAVAERQKVGDPLADDTVLGPLVSKTQWEKVQRLIKAGIDEGATLVTGGLGRPDGLTRGYYAKPTVFGDVRHDMTISREEIFGPVLSILPYRTEAEAIADANDTVYGLAAYVASTDIAHARNVARQLRAGTVNINYPAWDTHAPFGGYRQSGNGREYADWGLHDFLEIKGVVGYGT
ncbi:aldehyde dehydrogenase family protein [Paraburkholderia sp. J41]|uniref:aldehyde dehydrogenase family protein n=1 Tax=Paraburkholderia sp. J41 TaxID=2805433 RepID=UPI002AC3229D|nr:aldehyde dehydrogenase family protein [Paraburkholderia sp. J41]